MPKKLPTILLVLGLVLKTAGFLLRRIARARTDAEISRRVNELFSDPEIACEQAETAKDLGRVAPARGVEW